jgi:signal transduction histidine kinase
VVKHARGSQVTIWLRSNSEELWFSVTDDGSGFDPKSVTAGSGLRNMRERLAGLAGELSVGAGLQGGTVVSGRIPLAAVAALK